MATSAQLKALFKSFAEGDENRFYTYALQISAHEARRGHGKLAKELRDIIDAAKQNKEKITFGTTRSSINDVGEIRRILNSFLQFIDQDNSNSLILS
jgi:hypothetical protein